MRPILLKVKGLHSFREEQEVDFENLCGGGVFGIFGPTGSGKSSLLDAMTLALYGKVERASNNTQGIMNHAEDQLSVSFTFELGNAAGTKRYRVERRYKRTDEIKLKIATCRFVEIDGEEKVLADKDRDVTQHVQDILGLTVDDFTRAVVLPQGKFAEFLSLKGSERRQMLQRLFHLEKYGDILNTRLRKRTDTAKSRVNELTAEQQGLGEASVETIAQAKERVVLAQQSHQVQQARTAEAEKLLEAKKRLWELQAESVKTAKQLAEHRQLEHEIIELEKQLSLARQAEILRPYTDELTKGREEFFRWQARADEAAQQLAASRTAYGAAQEELRLIRQKLAEEEPRLTVRLERLKQAQELEDELHVLQASIAAQEKQYSVYAEQLADAQKAHEWSAKMREQAIQRQAFLQEELLKKSVAPAERQKVNQAVQEKQAIKAEQKRFADLQQEIQEYQKRCLKTEQDAALARDAGSQYQRHLQELLEDTQRQYMKVRDGIDRVNGVRSAAEQLLATERGALAEWIDRNLAVQLVASLQNGKPCPVCGSSEHPSPAIPAENDLGRSQIEERIGKLEEEERALTAAGHEYDRLSSRLQQVSSSLYDRLMHENSGADGAAASLDSHLLQEQASDEADLLLTIEQIKQGCRQIREQLTSYENDLQRLEESMRSALKKGSLIEQQQAAAAARMDNERKAVEERSQKAAQEESRITARLQQWNEAFAPLVYENAEGEAARIQALDVEAEELQQKLEKSYPYIAEREAELDRLQNQLTKTEHERIRLEAELTANRKNLTEKMLRLKQIVPEGEAAVLYKETENLLKNLRQQAAAITEKEEKARTQLQANEKDESAARQSLRLASTRKTEAEAAWIKAVAAAPFQTQEEVQQAMAGLESQKSWQERIERYRDKEKKLENELQRIHSLLSGETVSDEEWEEANAACTRAREALDLAAKEKIRSERDLEDLELRHARWAQLEELRVQQQQTIDRLVKLQNVFKGNSFVEYIAEEQLMQVSYEASMRLASLTRQRYAIEVDSTGGFIIRDDANGGIRRPVTTLSGGETFLTSLSLALALSGQIQLRGEYPLEFFFLDEGFGTLDQELLDTVITALEKLQSSRLSVGIISHVPELQARLPRKLIVEPAEPSGRGSRIRHEVL
ncbi:AAA family ATPase [Aneurinibacillus sp. Ricciae_BoGa-3]|uniref:AAA family ATPase n=1 Tax=Aneurinibacillus sp. Ricciae_BoGa-3 TaxID=3022697 RepID=UPI00233F92D4|nr:AAA family ATPase [Aneurinibacillus sp. Ricciae_BoGa-3]WCK56220.1 AAA family ATPase [Aneurinibacillus sp. Ricciae_BoGa-3]